jgi:hypothetical protein
LIRLEIARDGIGDHNIQFSERIALGRDATSTGGIPARHIPAGSRARFNVKEDFSLIAHTGKIRELETGVNQRTSQAIPTRRDLADKVQAQQSVGGALAPPFRRINLLSTLTRPK